MRWLCEAPTEATIPRLVGHYFPVRSGVARGRSAALQEPLQKPVSVRPRSYFYERMFPPTITSRPPKRSLRELVRGAMETALEFATLGEANTPRPSPRPASAAPTSEHPHRRRVDRHQRTRRPGTVRP